MHKGTVIRSKPVGPKKSVITQLLHELDAEQAHLYAFGMPLANVPSKRLKWANMAGKQLMYLQAYREVEAALWHGKYGSWERAAHLERLYRDMRAKASKKLENMAFYERMVSHGWVKEITAQEWREKAKGEVKGAQEIVKRLEAIGIGGSSHVAA